MSRTLDIEILAVNNSTLSIAYFDILKKEGIIPQKVTKIIFSDPSPKISFLPYKLSSLITLIVRKYKYYRELYQLKYIHDLILNEKDSYPDYYNPTEFNTYCCEYEEILVESVNDKKLVNHIKESKYKFILITGGGILEEEILNVGKNILHVHPGIVPYVRGSDGFLWSILTRGKPGMTCFIMNKGIDTGAILYQREYEKPVFFKTDILKLTNKVYEDIYRGILIFYEPMLRAKLFVEMVKEHELDLMKPISQDINEGRTFFKMHPRLRKSVIKNLLLSETNIIQ